MLGSESARVVYEPLVVEGGVEEDVLGDSLLDGINGSGLLGGAGNSKTVGMTALRPSSLSNDDAVLFSLAARGGRAGAEDTDFSGNEHSRQGGGNGWVEEWMDVSGNVVTSGSAAELTIAHVGGRCVDMNNASLETSPVENSSSGSNSINDTLDALAVLDVFVANTNAIDKTPTTGTLNLSDEIIRLICSVVDVKDTEHET